jgi:hypothetical protein
MEETTHFYLDGSKGIHDFVSREKPGPIHWPTFNIDPEPNWTDDTEVIVLRASLYFHAEQKITLGKLKEFFTMKGIRGLEKDGYIKIKEA